jgi:LysM repeat protein
MADQKYSNYSKMIRGEVSLDGLIQGLKGMLPAQRTPPEPLPNSSPLLNDLAQPRVQTGKPLPTTNMYKVQKGDNLSKIAEAQGRNLQQLLQLNPELRRNPNMIQPGQKINLGQATTQPRKAPPKPVTSKRVTPVTTTGPFSSPEDTVPLGDPAGGVAAPEPMQLNVVDNRTPLAVTRPTVERTIGQAGEGFNLMESANVNPLAVPDDKIFQPGQSASTSYKNSTLNSIMNLIRQSPYEPDGDTIKKISSLSKSLKGNKGIDLNEVAAVRDAVYNWSMGSAGGDMPKAPDNYQYQ